MNKYLEKIAAYVPSLKSSLKTVKGNRAPELGGLARPASAADTIKSPDYRPPTQESLRRRLKSNDLSYGVSARKDIY